MRKSQLLIILVLLALLLALNQMTGEANGAKGFFGGLPWWGWAGIGVFLIAVALILAVRDALEARRLLLEKVHEAKPPEEAWRAMIPDKHLEVIDADPQRYPHPYVVTERCIGCHACVEACPHDVLAIVNGVSTAIAPEQCMEDTSCQVECPVNPKACIVINTLKKIPPRKVPQRDASFMTNVPGCYIIGDVSGTPLIKNAANEGADVLKHLAHELHNGIAPEPKAEIDIAIIGAGPAGLSAALMAKRFKLSYVALEQDTTLSTIVKYPANKYVFLKPETMDWRGGIDLPGLDKILGDRYEELVRAEREGALTPEQQTILEEARRKVLGDQREVLLETWFNNAKSNGVVVNENESCKAVKKADDGDYFVVQTEKGQAKEKATYRARRVIIAIGNSGTPMKLRVPGEEMRVVRDGVEQDKVRYKLADPEAIKNKNVIVVGAGNSAIEAAVDMVARRHGDQIEFRPPGEINNVTLVIRSDFKNDLKFGNKMQVYKCIDAGKIKVFFGTAIKEIRENEVVLMNARTNEEKATIPNDFVFAMIGGDKPTKFLESIGIKIG
jgi:thioredoxin reductase (NADPH)